MKVEVLKLDNFGRGITYINDKICFIENALPNEVVEIEIIKETSKYISLILRHKPEVIGITLDEHGWANVDELIEGVSRTHKLDMAILEQIVAEDEKQRYSFNEDKTFHTCRC